MSCPKIHWTYSQAKAHADALDKMLYERWVKASRDCGLEPNGCVLHNAMLSAEEGKPWRGVNTRLLRKVFYVEHLRSRAWRLLDDYCHRMPLEVLHPHLFTPGSCPHCNCQALLRLSNGLIYCRHCGGHVELAAA